MLTPLVVERDFQSAAEWLERRAEEDPEWVDAAGMSDSLVYMTPAELRELDQGIRAGLAFPLPAEPEEEDGR